MYTKEDISRQKQAFWTAFGKYMQPIRSAEGRAVNWINYKTGASGIQFKMDADEKQAIIAIVLVYKDAGIREQQFEKLEQLKTMLEGELQGEVWHWRPNVTDAYGKTVSKVEKVLREVNIHSKEDWPAMISFLKERMIALDAWWSMVKDGFE